MGRSLIVDIVGDSSSLERAFKKSSVSAKRFQGQMEKTSSRTGRSFGAMGGSLKTLGFAGAGVAATSFLKESVSAASDLEQQIGKTDVVFGESAKGVEDWSKTLASSFGLSRREALTTASTLGALFAPIGLTGEAAAKQSEKLTQLGADLASFYNTDVQDALDALRSGLVGESEPLRKYGVLLSETRVQQQAMADTGKKSATELTNQEKVLARVKIILADSAVAQGDFARTSGQAAQQTKTFRANLEDLQANIGKYAVPGLNSLVTSANNVFDSFKRLNDPGPKVRTVEDLQAFLAKQDRRVRRRRLAKPFGRATDVVSGAVAAATDAAARRAAAAGKAAKEARKAQRELARAAAARVRDANEAARQSVLDRAEFNVEKTGATKTLKDDLAALRRYNALLTKRMRGGHGTLELEREQFRVQQQIADVLKQQADLAKKTRKKLGVDVTRFQKSARGQYVVPGGGGRGLVIAGGVHLHGVQNVSDLENQLARRSKQRAHQRRRR